MSGGPSDELLIARAYLSAVAEPPAPALVRFIEQHGAVRAARLVAEAKFPSDVADEVDARRERVDGADVLSKAADAGIRLVIPESQDWPHERFADLAAARSVGIAGLAEPIALWGRGRAAEPGGDRSLDPLANSIAIVGARAASGYGEHTASEFGHALAMAGFAVVSGAAYGIDGAAHRGALAAGQRTVAFLACGVDIDYPAGHARLLATIAKQGLVLSEYPPGTPPRKHRFLVRNRLIAAGGLATVVVEAGARSGAGNTANTADALGRSVLAVPGPVTSASSVGCHQMVREGKAMLVTKPAEVLEVVQPLGTAPQVETPIPQRRTDGLDRVSQRVHDAVAGREGASAEQIAWDSGLPLRKVRAALPALEMSGLIARKEHGWANCAL